MDEPLTFYLMLTSLMITLSACSHWCKHSEVWVFGSTIIILILTITLSALDISPSSLPFTELQP